MIGAPTEQHPALVSSSSCDVDSGPAAATANANSNANDRRRRGEEIFIKSLLLSSSNSSMASSSSSTTSKLSRKSSFRRRDVIKPLLVLDEEEVNNTVNSNNNNSPTFAAAVAVTKKKKKKKKEGSSDDERKVSISAAGVMNSATVTKHDNNRASHHHHNHHSSCTALVLHPLVVQQQEGHPFDYHHSSPLDPPGEAPTNHPIVCTDLMIVRGSNGGGSENGNTTTTTNNNNCYQNTVLWMDPKNVHDPNLVDWNVLRKYDDLMMASSSSSSSSPHSSYPSAIVAYKPAYTSHPLFVPSSSKASSSSSYQQPLLLSNPRTRIATISTGFKAAMFFVREDLDTRIYFTQLEDAIGYMGRRGYVKMRPEEEREWRLVLERAHKVVKVGPTKRKQLYRKGKIVLILKKTITNEKDGDYHNHAKKMMKSRNQKMMIESATRNKVGGVLTVRRAPRNKKQCNEEDEYSQATTTTTPSTNDNDDSNNSSASSSNSSSSDNRNSSNNNGGMNNLSKFKMLLDSTASASTADETDRTSLGRSTRWPYKSYSEKFLAQQDEEKRQCLLAIIEGRPLLLNGTAPAASTFLLTNGEEQQHRRLPIDPDADIIPSSCRSGCNNDDLKSSATEFEDSTCHGDMATRTTMGESNRSFHTMRGSSARGSARRGVYGGGVRYFTPDYSLYSESDDDDDNDDQNVSEEWGNVGSSEETEAENENGDAVGMEGSFSSDVDPTSVQDEEEGREQEEKREIGVSRRFNHDFCVGVSTPFVKKEAKKREKKMKKKEKKEGTIMNRSECRSNNRRRSAAPALVNDDSSSLSSSS